MMRGVSRGRKWLLALLAVIAIPVAAAPRDWTIVAAKSAVGAYVVGNPKAKVKLVEYVSYVCPHCAHFSQESSATLKGRMIASGSVNLEVRALIQDQIDLAAALTARCAGPANFLRISEQLFAQQNDWYWRSRRYVEANETRLSAYPPLERVSAIVDAGGIGALATANGLPAARLKACFASGTALEEILTIDQAARTVAEGTPTFVLNGKKITGAGWAQLEPMLRAAGAR